MQGVGLAQSLSQATLRRVKENDETLESLWIGGTVIEIDNDEDNKVVELPNGMRMPLRKHDGVFNHSSDDKEFTSLGDYIAENTHLTKLVHVDGRVGLEVECLRRNSSIHELNLICGGQTISEGVIHNILQVYQEKGNLTRLDIQNTNLQNGGDSILVNTLKSCTNLKKIALFGCGINGDRLTRVVEAIRGHRMLEELYLFGNSIGNAGCTAIATLLEDPNCNLRHLNLLGNNIGNEGVTTIANSLANNTTLQKLILIHSRIDQNQSVVEESFCKVLCNTSSISDVYSSNHTLKCLGLSHQWNGDLCLSLLKLNRGGANKADIAMKKILKHYPDMDMEPLFEWDAEEEERNLKALPYVVDWFERAESAFRYDWNNYDKKLYNEPAQETIAEDVEEERFIVEKRKLDAINQFARAMPLLFEGVSTM
jgi:hypothetical protein